MLSRLILDIPRRPEGLGKVIIFVGGSLTDEPIQQQSRSIDIGIPVS